MKSYHPIKSYVIVGGGTAGWTSAAILSKALKHTQHTITLVESPDIPTIGVGEATIPSFVDLLEYLRIPLGEFIANTNATFKLGIKFTDWRKTNHHYWHQFGEIGTKVDGVPFYQHWLRHTLKHNKFELTDFSPSIALAKQNKFYIAHPQQPTNLSKSTFALHFDAGRVAEFLMEYCLKNQVKLIKANVTDTHLDDQGQISAVELDNGNKLDGEFFIDCSGQRAILINKSLRVGYTNWQHYLPVDRAITAQSETSQPLPPYTESIAHEHGWRWRIPLQNRTGNGYVYCSDYCHDDEAVALLRRHTSQLITEPRTIRFVTGMRNEFWYKNCLAVGLSGGFLEPLESTSIYLIMRTMLDFIQSLPMQPIQQPTVDEFNRKLRHKYEGIRDFIVLHYCVSERKDSEFWRMWQHMSIPETLAHKLTLFKSQGRVYDDHYDLFSEQSWLAVFEGMGIRPASYDPLVNGSVFSKVEQAMDESVNALNQNASKCLDHDQFLKKSIGL